MKQRILPVLIDYRTPDWIKVAFQSYRQHFPDDHVLLIDNNPIQGERLWEPSLAKSSAWLRDRTNVTVRQGPRRKRHGLSLDLAMQHCRDHGYEIMLQLEPDCLISGRHWYELLLTAIEGGALMVGSHRKSYGPVHPCPSMWVVGDWASFEVQPRGKDVYHPRFQEVFNLPALIDEVRLAEQPPKMVEWWRTNWDTTQKNWFLAAVQDRAALVPESDDFRHFWTGSVRQNIAPSTFLDKRVRENPQLAPFLES